MKLIGYEGTKQLWTHEQCDICKVCGAICLYKNCDYDRCKKAIGNDAGFFAGYICIYSKIFIQQLRIQFAPKHFCNMECMIRWLISKKKMVKK